MQIFLPFSQIIFSEIKKRKYDYKKIRSETGFRGLEFTGTHSITKEELYIMEGKVYGYIRVSTREQNEDRQRIAMKEYGVPEEHMYIDWQSGKDFDRPGYRELMGVLGENDTFVIKSIDRLGRNFDEILEQWRMITAEKHAGIIVLDMPILNTGLQRDLLGRVIAEMMLTLMSYVAETERENIRQRQAEGIAAARQKGVRLGRKPKEIPEEFEAVRALWEAGTYSATAAARKMEKIKENGHLKARTGAGKGWKIGIGTRVGMLTVTTDTGQRKNRYTVWECQCSCGGRILLDTRCLQRESVVGQTLLQSGKTKSCGCLQAGMYKENLKLVEGTSVAILEAHKRKLNRNNTSGHTGVYLDGRQGKWVAQIGFKGKKYYLGSYRNKQDAVEARRQGEQLHDTFLQWYYSKESWPESKKSEG